MTDTPTLEELQIRLARMEQRLQEAEDRMHPSGYAGA